MSFTYTVAAMSGDEVERFAALNLGCQHTSCGPTVAPTHYAKVLGCWERRCSSHDSQPPRPIPPLRHKEALLR